MTRRLLFSDSRIRVVMGGLAPQTKRKLRAALDALRRDGPVENKQDVKALHSPGRGMYRLRVDDWRVAFRMHGRDIEVIHVFHRRDGYGWMERMR